MKSEHNEAERILSRALEFALEEREVFLAGACGDDASLRDRVATLLRAHDEADQFLNDGITVEETTVLERPGTMIGRYKLLQQIGEGGMGAVYMAEQTEPVSRKVALKIIKLGMDTKQVVARFEAERQALALMDHPNIAKVLDAGATEAGRPYFVMELVRGIPVTEYCDKNKLSTKQRLELFIPICQAIQHAHQKGVIHRDIKPSNVMVTLHDGNPVPKVIDFGIAKAVNQKLTEKTLFTNYAQMIGTPAYMSPEQAEMSGLDVDTRTDVYSLGVLLYEILTGTTPFPSQALMSQGYGEMQRIIAEEEPPKPSTRLSTMQNEERTVVARNRSMEVSALGRVFQGDLDWIVMRTLEKDRTRRYETANGLVEDIRRHLNNEPVNAVAPTFFYQLAKFYRRNRSYMRAALIVVVLLLTATVFSFYQAVLAQRAARAEAVERKRADVAREAEQALRQDLEREQLNTEFESEQRRAKVFASDMFRAARYLEDGNIEMVDELLSAYSSEETLEGGDLRDLAWRYLWARSRGDALATLDSEFQGEVVVSPKGTWIASSSIQGTLIREAKYPWTIVERLPEQVDSLSFSRDERWLAGAKRDELIIWNSKTWEIEKTLEGHSYPARFSHSGPWLATRVDEDCVLVDVPHFEEKGRFGTSIRLGGTPDPWWFDRDSVAFSNDGRWLTFNGQNRYRDFVDLATLERIEEFAGVVPSSGSVAISPDSRLIASPGLQEIEVRDIENLSEVIEVTIAGPGALRLEFSPDGRSLVAAGMDMVLYVFDVHDSFSLANQLIGNRNEVWSLAISTNSKHIYTGAIDAKLKVWDLKPGEKRSPGEELAFYPLGFGSKSSQVFGIKTKPEWGAEGRLVLLERSDPEATAVELTTVEVEKLGSDRGGWAIDVSSSGRFVAFGMVNGLLRVWDQERLEYRDAVVFREGETIRELCIHPLSENLVAVGTASGGIALWDSEQGRIVEEWPRRGGAITSLSFSRSGRFVVYAGRPESPDQKPASFLVFDRETQSTIIEEPGTFQGSVFSPIEDLLVMAREDGEIFAWDVDEGTLRYHLNGHTLGTDRVAFSPDGAVFMSGSYDRTLRFWHAPTGTEMVTIQTDFHSVPMAISHDSLLIGESWKRVRGRHVSLPSVAEIDASSEISK